MYRRCVGIPGKIAAGVAAEQEGHSLKSAYRARKDGHAGRKNEEKKNMGTSRGKCEVLRSWLGRRKGKLEGDSSLRTRGINMEVVFPTGLAISRLSRHGVAVYAMRRTRELWLVRQVFELCCAAAQEACAAEGYPGDQPSSCTVRVCRFAKASNQKCRKKRNR